MMALAAIVGWQDYAYTRRALASDLEAKPLGMMAYFWHGNKTCTATNKSCIFGRCRALSFYPHLGRPLRDRMFLTTYGHVCRHLCLRTRLYTCSHVFALLQVRISKHTGKIRRTVSAFSPRTAATHPKVAAAQARFRAWPLPSM